MSGWEKSRPILTILILLWGILSVSSCNTAEPVPPDAATLQESTPSPRVVDATATKLVAAYHSTVTESPDLSTGTSPNPGSPIDLINPTATPTLVPGPLPLLEPIDIHYVEHGDRKQPLVALTFDLCQDPSNPSGFDEDIYRALVNAEAPATFFMGGDWMRTHIEETRMLASVPFFDLGNHSWSHPDFRDLDEVEMSQEIWRSSELLYELTGQQSRLFRFPGGTYNTLALSVAAWQGQHIIQWDVVTADPVPDNTAAMILARVNEQVANGSIIVMHANGRGWHTGQALPLMIQDLREEFCLVTVSQLLGLEPLPQACEE